MNCEVTVCVVFGSLLCVALAAGGAQYPREHIYDTAVRTDDALVHVRVRNCRWPDCTTLESTIQDIFRLEGATDKSDQAKAFALWKWFRILVSGTGGAYAYEHDGSRWQIVKSPHKIFTVYGHHQCDGQSWAMVPLWRAAGYMAFDECHHGHTIAALRYLDDDGVLRYHSFDPQGRFYWWDAKAGRVGTWRMPVMTGTVYRHLLTPQHLHSLHTSLRVGETVVRQWDNEGHVLPSDKPMGVRSARYARYYDYRPGRTDGIYAAVGQETQTLVADTTAAGFRRQLAEGSENTACSSPVAGKAALHPKTAGRTAAFIYRLPPPYVAVDATVEATLHKGQVEDVCRLRLSLDGRPWKTVFEKESVGAEKVSLDLGMAAAKAGRPSVYSGYEIRLRLECRTAGDVRSVGASALKATVYRMLSKRTLPNLMPGGNVFQVTAAKAPPEHALRLEVHYQRDGEPKKVVQTIRRFPHYFRIDEPGWQLRRIGNYDQDFNNEAVRMTAIRMRLVPAGDAAASPSLPAEKAEAAFRTAFPHPADMTRRREVREAETDPIQTNGFFPQSRTRLKDPKRMAELIATVRQSVARNGGSSVRGWQAAQELGNYPDALDFLCEVLPKANIDLTLYLCKALAQIADRRAIGPLLAKWRLAPRGAPGTRYIPDVLAAIGERSVVPKLVEKLPKCRFDFRFHVAHALGVLGGPAAERALQELAKNDPFPAVRQEARRALGRLKASP
jgi:hypothetical protein